MNEREHWSFLGTKIQHYPKRGGGRVWVTKCVWLHAAAAVAPIADGVELDKLLAVAIAAEAGRIEKRARSVARRTFNRLGRLDAP